MEWYDPLSIALLALCAVYGGHFLFANPVAVHSTDAGGGPAHWLPRRQRFVSRELAFFVAAAASLLLYAYTVSRGLRSPNEYALSHWLLSYETGFVKRALLGALVRPLLVGKTIPQVVEIVNWFSSGIFFLFSSAVLASALYLQRRELALGSFAGGGVLSLAFLSSPFLVVAAHVTGYADQLLCVFALGSIYLLHRGRLLAVAALSIVALLIHEIYAFYGLPMVFFALVLFGSREEPGKGWKRRLFARTAFVLGPALVVLLALSTSHALLTSEDVATIRASAARFTDMPDSQLDSGLNHLRTDFGEALADQGTRFFRRLSRDPQLLRSVIPSTAVLLVGTAALLRSGGLARLIPMLAACAFAPLAALLFAWDAQRFVNGLIFHAFAGLFATVLMLRLSRPSRPLALAILLGTALVTWDNISVRVPLMDHQLDGVGLFSTDVPNKLRELSFEHWLRRGHDR